jgi:hypothetical protein
MVFINYYDLTNVRTVFEKIAIVGAGTFILTGIRPVADKFLNTENEYIHTCTQA